MGIGDWLTSLSAAFDKRDADAAAALFDGTAFWRDILAFTWDVQTLEGSSAIRAMLRERMATVGKTGWTLGAGADAAASEGFIRFETAVGRGQGYVRLVGDQCLTLLTAMDELKGHEEARGSKRPIELGGGAHGTWHDNIAAERATLGITDQPYVLIIGGGQGGLGLAARLRMLKVPTIVVDRYARSGDQWRSRYASLSLHDPVWYDHMPYLPFPDSWPVFTPKEKLADWLESYETLMELNVWHSTTCLGAAYDDVSDRWRILVERAGERLELMPTHLVLATGNSGAPNRPVFRGMEVFKGLQCHSSEHPGGEGLAGKNVVVIGSNNSAHDICADLIEHKAHATMVQRSATHIVRQQTFIELQLSGLYSEEAVANGLTTDRADLIAASVPLRMLPIVHQPVAAEIKRRDADYYADLEAAGFMLDFGEDDTGIMGKYMRRASGYYIDVGASALIADGTIALRSGVEVDRIVEDGVTLSTGEQLTADVIIYATGYGSMDSFVATLISPQIAERIGKVWGYGSGTAGDPGPWEGELRNMWKPTAQPGLWFHGGNLAQSRFYSTCLALQFKARFEGLPTPVYKSALAG